MITAINKTNGPDNKFAPTKQYKEQNNSETLRKPPTFPVPAEQPQFPNTKKCTKTRTTSTVPVVPSRPVSRSDDDLGT